MPVTSTPMCAPMPRDRPPALHRCTTHAHGRSAERDHRACLAAGTRALFVRVLASVLTACRGAAADAAVDAGAGADGADGGGGIGGGGNPCPAAGR